MREKLKQEALEVIEPFKKGLLMRSPHTQRLADLIARQDAYIDKLSRFIEEITIAGGKYKHLNGDIIVVDAYKILGD